MNPENRQMIGVLDTYGNSYNASVGINKIFAIQYTVKSLLLPNKEPLLFTGYLSSFEHDELEDDKSLPNALRIENFLDRVGDSFFIFSYRYRLGGGYPQMQKLNLEPRPERLEGNPYFYGVPVFAASYDAIINEWQKQHHWKSYRHYQDLREFQRKISSRESVGSVYGYDMDAFVPSFVLWKDENGVLFAVGKIGKSYCDVLGGVILEGNHTAAMDISNYLPYIVYSISTNPMVAYIPDFIYEKIERELSETITLQEDSTSTEDSRMVDEEQDSDGDVEKNVIAIDTSVKNDELVIQCMDYYSRKNKLYYSMKDFVNVHTAVKCSNLVILSGLSGTGKSQLVEVYAKALGIDTKADIHHRRLLFIPVRPSWNDDADLLGYVDLVHMVYRAADTGFVDLLVNAQKEENRQKLYLVCFDEMNLARVEHYFSQFLSILERQPEQRELQLYDEQYTGKLYNANEYPSKLMIGDNIRFIGTVNLDESTYHFSDKVLDRANVIELNVLNYAKDWIEKPYKEIQAVCWEREDYYRLIAAPDNTKMQRIRELLWELHQLMQTAGTKYGVGPRIVTSIETYLCNLPKKVLDGFDEKVALDYQVMQRVLTKVRGSESQLGEMLKDSSEQNFFKIFDQYQDISDFEKCRRVIMQKQKELETYGYCI